MSNAIYMFNALWFKPTGGKEKYSEYAASLAPIFQKAGAELRENYQPEKSLIGEWEPDVFFVVRYPTEEAFISMIESSEYSKIAHLREEALEKSLLVRCKPYDWV